MASQSASWRHESWTAYLFWTYLFDGYSDGDYKDSESAHFHLSALSSVFISACRVLKSLVDQLAR